MRATSAGCKQCTERRGGRWAVRHHEWRRNRLVRLEFEVAFRQHNGAIAHHLLGPAHLLERLDQLNHVVTRIFLEVPPISCLLLLLLRLARHTARQRWERRSELLQAEACMVCPKRNRNSDALRSGCRGACDRCGGLFARALLLLGLLLRRARHARRARRARHTGSTHRTRCYRSTRRLSCTPEPERLSQAPTSAGDDRPFGAARAGKHPRTVWHTAGVSDTAGVVGGHATLVGQWNEPKHVLQSTWCRVEEEG
jgi:hypothetical protein